MILTKNQILASKIWSKFKFSLYWTWPYQNLANFVFKKLQKGLTLYSLGTVIWTVEYGSVENTDFWQKCCWPPDNFLHAAATDEVHDYIFMA